jgi:glycerol-3-phosphate dehydrogenase
LRADPKTLDRESLEFLVIGGGIQGAAIAREAALRGASVLLVEREDFGCGTSSQSSRLIHGGLRYLEHGHLSLVREALHERERLLRLAPHLVRPLPMLMPFYKGGGRKPWLVKAGLKLYGVLAGRHSLPGARSHGIDDCVRLFPNLRRRDLLGGSVFYDARTVDQRLTMAVVEAARAAGATILNHAAVAGVAGGGVLLRDALTDDEFTVRSEFIVNATGPGVDGVRALLGVAGEDLVRVSRGSHVVLDAMPGELALAAFLPDKRIQFVIPHRDGTICGTTEVESPGAEGEVPEDDLEYLLAALEYLLEAPPTRADVRFAYTGWRALPTGKGPAGGANREAFLEAERGTSGLVHTVVGGKLTTHRAFAERVVNRLLGLRTASPSREQFLPGGAGPQEFGDPLWWRHGDRAPRLRAMATGRPDLLEPICPHRDLLRVEAAFSLREQATMTFADLMRRRLFHSHGPCLHPSCLDSCHELFTEFMPEGARADAAVDKADLVRQVERAVGALLR